MEKRLEILYAKKIEEVARTNKTIIYGTGEATIRALEHLKGRPWLRNIEAIIDESNDCILRDIQGVPVVSPQLLESSTAKFILINELDRERAIQVFNSLKRFSRRYVIRQTSPLLDNTTDIPTAIEYMKKTNEKPVLIYQMGKVGSSTIFHSLEQCGVQGWHVHLLTEKYETWRKGYEDSRTIKELFNLSQNEKLKIITLVRDPISRNVASFFETVGLTYSKFIDEYNSNKDKVIDYLIKLYFEGGGSHNFPLSWWDNELNNVFGINVFETGFDKIKGYQIYQNETVEVLLIKMEKINECAGSAIGEFLGIDRFELFNSNVGEDKLYNEVYRDFKERIEFSTEYVDRFYDSKVVHHFYTEDEITAFKRRIRII